MTRLSARWFALLIVVSLAFAGGCSALISQDDAGAKPQSGGAAGKTTAPRGGELRLLSSDPPTLDPHISGDVVSAEFVVEVFSGLVKLNERLEVAPEIAERWTVSADGREYTFKLRDNVRFHDGRPLTADDIKFSIERAMDPRTASPTVDAYLNDIEGALDVIAGRTKELKGLQVIDPQTVKITIVAPKFYFLSKLTYPTSYVVDRNQLNRPNWFERPNATGPFRLTEYRRGDRITLERNDRYYGNPQPSLNKVTIYLSGAAITRYENNEIDISPVSLIDIDRVRDPRDPLSKQFMETETLDTSYIGMNVLKPPFDDVKVRQAFNHATDKRRIADVVLRNLYTVAEGIVPPGMPGYDKRDFKGLAFDPARARQLLSESRYRDARGLGRIVFSTAGQAASVGPTLEAILDNWKQHLGVEVEIQQTEYAIFLQDLNTRKYQIFDIGWSADYPDPQNFLDLLLYSKSSQNTTNYSNPAFDRLIDSVRTQPDPTIRNRIYLEAERIAVQDAPWIPLFHAKKYEVVKPYVKGYAPTRMTIPYLAGVSIERK